MKKRKMSQAWKNRIWNGSILAAFVAAMAVFVFLLQTEKRVLTEYEKEQVCVVTAAIPRGEKISAENAEQYITVMEIDKRIVPETALKSTEAASGRIAAYGVEQGMVLTTGMLLELSEITEQMREPVIAGFRAEDLYQVVGGVVTVWQHLRHSLPAARKAAQNVFRADVVPAALYTVCDACKAFLRRVKADIEQPDGIAIPLGSGCCLRRVEV